MIIDCISDLHGYFPKLQGGDILIIAGDFTAYDSVQQWNNFFDWLHIQKYKRKILVSGNHDNFSSQWALSDDSIYDMILDRPSFTYLRDSGIEIDGLKIWGSPWTKTFPRMNPKCKAFTVDTEEELAEKWSLIPEDIDILITHSPPFGILDGVPLPFDGSLYHAGSKTLADEIQKRKKPPKLWVFGHIHEAYGYYEHANGIRLVNASIVNEKNKPVNPVTRIIL